ncbi:hypothetical protein [Chitinimonas sp.]|uniref:hypothetical protein n=1 Tax=Chitinimonas sp. TaxID=1934313 RepID=UPI002F91CEC2
MKLKDYFKLKPGNRLKLARAAGTEAAYLSQIAGGHKIPSLQLARAIRDATQGQVSYDDLLPELEATP